MEGNRLEENGVKRNRVVSIGLGCQNMTGKLEQVGLAGEI